MLIQEFKKIYCKDSLSDKIKKFALEDIDLTYDKIVTDEEGKLVKVVYAEDGTEIAIEDILTLVKSDFSKYYNNNKSALEMYDKYLKTFIILEGEDVLNAIRNQVNEVKERMNKFESLPEEAFD